MKELLPEMSGGRAVSDPVIGKAVTGGPVVIYSAPPFRGQNKTVRGGWRAIFSLPLTIIHLHHLVRRLPVSMVSSAVLGIKLLPNSLLDILRRAEQAVNLLL